MLFFLLLYLIYLWKSLLIFKYQIQNGGCIRCTEKWKCPKGRFMLAFEHTKLYWTYQWKESIYSCRLYIDIHHLSKVHVFTHIQSKLNASEDNEWIIILLQSCQPVTFKKSIIELKKPYFEMKKGIFARGARITSAKRKVLSAGVQGPLKGPGSTQVLGALWCNLSLIFLTLNYSKTLTKFS